MLGESFVGEQQWTLDSTPYDRVAFISVSGFGWTGQTGRWDSTEMTQVRAAGYG